MIWISLAVIVAIVAISSSYLLLAIRSISVEMGTKIQYETQKMVSTYNEVIDAKTKVIEELDINKLDWIEREIEERVKAEIKKEKSKVISQGGSSFSQGNYCDKRIGFNYSVLRKLTHYCTVEQCSAVLSHLANQNNRAEHTNLEDISFDTLYKLSHLNQSDQYNILWNEVDEIGKNVIKEYCKEDKQLNVLDLYDYMQINRRMNSNQLEVRLSPNLETTKLNKMRGINYMIDESLIEGFDILCNATLYNYSISEKEIN